MFDLVDDDPLGLALDPDWVLPARISQWARIEPGRPFMQEITGRSATYGEFVDLMHLWCGRLLEFGVAPGDRIITMIPSSIDAHALWLAAGCVGAIEVPVNPELRGTFLEHALRDPGARLCIVRPELRDAPDSIDADGLTVVTVARDGTFTAGAPAHEPETFPAPTDPACVIYTSGTTGPAKGVIISWAQMTATIGRIPRTWLSGDDSVYAYHPMFHVTGRSPLPAMSDVGGRLVLREKLSVTSFWADVREFGCTSTSVNTALLLAAAPEDDDLDNPLRIGFAAGNRSVAHDFQERFGVQLLEAYGSTEVGFPIMRRSLPTDGRQICGKPRRGYGARVVDETGADVEDGDWGELWVRPPAPSLMTSGYLGLPELTAEAIQDGWYRTGDRFLRHPDGNLQFVDRMKDTIRRLGENISATALESVIIEEPDVAECAAVGVPDAVSGQEVLVAVIGHADSGIDPAELHGRLRQRLPRHMVPAFLAIVDELPRTPTNKIRRMAVREALAPDEIWAAPRH